jgi:type IV fimbrial biogenesis protein FimT
MLNRRASFRLAPARARGFTIVELMVAVVIAAILMTIAAPAMRSFIENARIRATSESLQSGLALARNEAVRQNRAVEFVSRPTGWVIRLSGAVAVMHSASGKEGRKGITLTISPTDATRITYDQFGRVMPNADGSASLTRIDIASSNPPSSGIYRPLSVQLQATGAPRVCDPSVGTTDSKACL